MELTPERVALFCRLHQLETWFRELVYVETKARFGATWWTECTAALTGRKGRKRGGIPPEKSLKRDAKHHHMATPENDPLWFVSFDSLLNIVFDRKLWPLFAPYLTTKQLVRAKLLEVMPIRHRIAHCRALHPDDLARVERVLKDLDQGFWRFCASYNTLHTPRKGARKPDPAFEFISKGLNPSKRTEVSASILFRASAKVGKRLTVMGCRGALYDVRFVAVHPNRFNSADVLKYSSPLHDEIVHIILDEWENCIRITIPAVLGEAKVNRTIQGFDEVCRNSTTPFRHSLGKQDADFDSLGKLTQGRFAEMRALAAEWPHYVIHPGSQLALLDSEMSGRFFGV